MGVVSIVRCCVVLCTLIAVVLCLLRVFGVCVMNWAFRPVGLG